MPPIQSQGSRAGLITALVIFVILFVTATIFAIYFNVEMRKKEEDYGNLKKRYVTIVDDRDLAGSGEIDSLLTLSRDSSSPYAGLKAINVAISQRDAIAKLISGSAAAEAPAAAQKSLLDTANTLKAIHPPLVTPTSSLTSNLAVLANAVVDREAKLADLKAKLKAATTETVEANTRFTKVGEDTSKTIEGIRADKDSAITEAQSDRTKKQSQIDAFEKAREEERKAAAELQTKAQQTLSEKDRQIVELNKKIELLTNKLAGRRGEVTGPIVSQVDANILRIPGNGIVYINRGMGDQITPGLTFQVYDKAEGLPPLGDGTSDENMPIGKGSIEVVRVGPTSSECRVLKTTPGATFSEGDLLVNLVYDVNTKYNFVVHGDFDTDRDGRATPAEAEVIKRLIAQWGGKTVDQVTVDTDFVVLGKEPVLPTFTKEELNNPGNLKIMTDAQAALKAYEDVRQSARDLHIPILNQNRFLYYVGYYEQSKR